MTPILVREVSELVLHPRTSIPSSAPAPAASTSSGTHVKFGGDSDDEKEKKKKAAAPAAAAPRDHARDNSRYYGVTTLNQVMLKKEQGEVAAKMVDVYFEVFGDVLGRLPDKEDSDDEKEKEVEKVAGKKRSRDEGKNGGKKGGKKGKGPAEEQDAVNDVDAKLVAAVLTGINRAFPFAKLDDVAFVSFLFLPCLPPIAHSLPLHTASAAVSTLSSASPIPQPSTSPSKPSCSFSASPLPRRSSPIASTPPSMPPSMTPA
jgi:ribosome biogenesis protein MAK21